MGIDESIKVSVIVLTYNHEHYIQQALDGILMQDVEFSIEILVGDDASTDRTADILREYQRKYPDVIKPVLREKNIGPTRNAYELFLLAKGVYLATCEGDDYWVDSKKLHRQIQFLDTHPEYVGCSHTPLVVDENGVPRSRQKLRWICSKQEMSLQDFKGYYLPGQASTLVRRNIYGQYATQDLSFFFRAHWAIGDRTTALIYLSKGKFYQFSEPMGCYRVAHTQNSVTTKVYRDNTEWLGEELAFTKQLMNFAQCELKTEPDFHFYLACLLLSACLRYLESPKKQSQELINEVLSAAPSKKRLFKFLPEALWMKVTSHFLAI